MSTYKQAGVDITTGDACSRIAYGWAKSTFPSRAGMIGSAVKDDEGFTGAIDMGSFLLVHNTDTVRHHRYKQSE
ncbi:MAG: hypothetical protein UY05_C0073G0005 [Candidatus Peregrinibacteria bacterium GW2011_GWA2_47_7]|nr:MAG: hypothetical protein UY05_C0073G0005 [Candidatus Peregrinibacteria bacterium GW2011_GWA2_47_7]